MAAGIVHAVRGLVRGTARAASAVGRGCAHLWRTRRNFLTLWAVTLAALLALSFLTTSHGEHGDVSAAMRDAVLHDVNRVSLFGLKDVNPGLIAAMTVSGVLLFTAALIRLLVIPRFRDVPGRFQLALETLVRTLDGLAKVEDPAKRTFIGAYVFAAGVYIFVGTLFELFGLQAVTTEGASVALPAPLSDVNAAIAMGCGSYLVIVCGGMVKRGGAGVTAALKEFSLPISMSFRLFGALLSGLLVTELVYHYAALRYVIPVVVAVIFTLLHAIVQSYVLTMLVGMYFHEVTEAE
ncbi:MAG: F0F1 ATP synthase subunit A [Oscillibacter sp.]|nr:F0F1 ATP synthase subunit A [Oscillibacter sp.]